MIGRCVDNPLIFAALLLDFVYAMMVLMSDHTNNIHNRG